MPKLAQEAHKKAIDATVEEALRRAGISAAQLSAIAVTVRPRAPAHAHALALALALP